MISVKEHVAIIIMSSTAAGSATAIQVISVQDCKSEILQCRGLPISDMRDHIIIVYYNNKMVR